MITASIVTYRTSITELDRCLHCLLESARIEWVMIVDNGGEPERIGKYCNELEDARVKYVANSNVGYGAGHNMALRKADQEFHLVINSDVYFSKGTLEALEDYLKEEVNQDVVQVIPRVENADGSLQFACRLLPTPVDLFCRRFLPKSWSEKRNATYTLAFTGYKEPMNVPYHLGCFMLLRTKALDAIAIAPSHKQPLKTYFDERYFLYPEDIDLTRRMHRIGRTMFWPGVTITHEHRQASYHSWHMTCIHLREMCKYFMKWGWLSDSERKTFNQQLLAEIGKQNS